ncbi:exosome complex exonuclease RRP [Salix suchowensis]|nr:exosome complex exonuclease RRP [Salix suchowensis]
MAVARIKLLRNKREAVMRQMRRDIALLLRSGQDATARIRVVSRLSIIAKRRECPADLKEGIASLLFASPRCSEITELVALRKIFEKKYGKILCLQLLICDLIVAALWLHFVCVLSTISFSLAEDEVEDVHLVPGSADDAPRTSIPAPSSTSDTNPASYRPSGCVVGIIKRNWHSYCGSLEPMPMPAGRGGLVYALFVSKDRRIPKIRIQTRQLENLLDKRIIVAVDSWDRQSRHPSSHYVRSIGEIEILKSRAEMTPEAEIISTKYTKSIIKSSAALSYVEAQARMDDSRLVDPLTKDLRNMNALAKIMRQRRIQRGALTLASAEVKFQIDTETHDPLDIGMYQIREANQMVEEFMLAANVSVAEKILKEFPECSLLRRHPTPTKEMLGPLLRTAAAAGLNLDVTSSKALADSLDRAVGDDPYFNKLIRIMATRCMTQAVYFCSGELSPPEFLHYGLAAPLYTHFTSPIRRYAGCLLHASIGIYKLPTIFQDRPQLTSIADNLNYRHRNAQMASRGSVELHTLIYFRNRLRKRLRSSCTTSQRTTIFPRSPSQKECLRESVVRVRSKHLHPRALIRVKYKHSNSERKTRRLDLESTSRRVDASVALIQLEVGNQSGMTDDLVSFSASTQPPNLLEKIR